MKNHYNFLAGAGSCFLLISNVFGGSAADIANKVDPSKFSTVEDLINYIISIVGGILATIVLNILKKKFPTLFVKAKKNE